MKGRQTIRNQQGFTLIEIIAVLVLIGILAAVAVPKYMDLQSTAKAKAAQGQVAEMKGTINLAYSKLFMANGTAPTAAATVTEAGFTAGTAANVGTDPDIWNVTLTVAEPVVTITINNRDDDTGYTATGTWTKP